MPRLYWKQGTLKAGYTGNITTCLAYIIVIKEISTSLTIGQKVSRLIKSTYNTSINPQAVITIFWKTWGMQKILITSIK
jgi:hypothetical protein